jgi:hypothetical protein
MDGFLKIFHRGMNRYALTKVEGVCLELSW